MIIFGGVDGTGVWNNDKYAKTFEYSFVRILYILNLISILNSLKGLKVESEE